MSLGLLVYASQESTRIWLYLFPLVPNNPVLKRDLFFQSELCSKQAFLGQAGQNRINPCTWKRCQTGKNRRGCLSLFCTSAESNRSMMQQLYQGSHNRDAAPQILVFTWATRHCLLLLRNKSNRVLRMSSLAIVSVHVHSTFP